MSAAPGRVATSIAPSPRSGVATTAILARGAVADASRREGGGEGRAFAHELGRIGNAGTTPNAVRAASPIGASRRIVPDGEEDRSTVFDAVVPVEAAIVGGTADGVPEPSAPGVTGAIPPAVPINAAVPSSVESPIAAGDAVGARAANGGSAAETMARAAPVVASDAPIELGPVVGTAPRDTASVVPTAPAAVETSERASTSGTSDEELVAPDASAAHVATTSGPTAPAVGGSRSGGVVDTTGAGETDRDGNVRAVAEGTPRLATDTLPPAMPGNASGRDAAAPLADRNRGEDVSDATSNRVDANVRRPRSAPRAEDRGTVGRPAPPVLPAVPASVRRALADGVPVPRGDTGDTLLPTPPAAATAGQSPDAASSDIRPPLPVGIARALRAAETVPAERATGVDTLLEASPPGATSRTLPGEAAGTAPATSSSAAVTAAAVPVALAPLATRPETAPLPTASIAPQTVPLDGAGGGAETLAANVRWTAGEGRGQAWINVSPAALGPLAIRVSVEGEQVSVSIAASQAGAREALEPLIPRLREQLAADGHQSVHVDLSGGREDPRASADGRDARAGTDGGGRSESGRTANGEDERNARHAADARPVPEGPTAGLAGGHALVDAWA